MRSVGPYMMYYIYILYPRRPRCWKVYLQSYAWKHHERLNVDQNYAKRYRERDLVDVEKNLQSSFLFDFLTHGAP